MSNSSFVCISTTMSCPKVFSFTVLITGFLPSWCSVHSVHHHSKEAREDSIFAQTFPIGFASCVVVHFLSPFRVITLLQTATNGRWSSPLLSEHLCLRLKTEDQMIECSSIQTHFCKQKTRKKTRLNKKKIKTLLHNIPVCREWFWYWVPFSLATYPHSPTQSEIAWSRNKFMFSPAVDGD